MGLVHSGATFDGNRGSFVLDDSTSRALKPKGDLRLLCSGDFGMLSERSSFHRDIFVFP